MTVIILLKNQILVTMVCKLENAGRCYICIMRIAKSGGFITVNLFVGLICKALQLKT